MLKLFEDDNDLAFLFLPDRPHTYIFHSPEERYKFIQNEYPFLKPERNRKSISKLIEANDRKIIDSQITDTTEATSIRTSTLKRTPKLTEWAGFLGNPVFIPEDNLMIKSGGWDPSPLTSIRFFEHKDFGGSYFECTGNEKWEYDYPDAVSYGITNFSTFGFNDMASSMYITNASTSVVIL